MSWAATTTRRSFSRWPTGSRAGDDRTCGATRSPSVIALGSIGLGILVALAAANLGSIGGTFATVVGWIAIAVINVVHARSR